MKKRAFLILTLISILALVGGTASAAMESKSVKLISTQFVDHKGVVFKFETTGLSKADLNSAYAYAGGNLLSVDCHQQGDGIVACTVKDINQYAGKEVMISLAGFGFWTTVPGEYTCYGFYYQLYGLGNDVFRPYNALTKGEVMSWEVPDYVTNLNYCVKEKWNGYPAEIWP